MTETSREDLSVEYSTAKWGGETAKVTVNSGELAGRSFWLRSTKGLESDRCNDLDTGGGIHVDGSEPDVGHFDWRGAFKTFDIEEAIDLLIEYINELSERRRVEEATYGELSDLEEALSSFSDSLRETSSKDFKEEWRRIQAAVVAMELKMTEVGAK